MLTLTTAVVPARRQCSTTRRRTGTCSRSGPTTCRARARPGAAARDRRLHRHDGPQRQPVGQGDRGDRLLCAGWPTCSGGTKSPRRYRTIAEDYARALAGNGRRRRPLPPGVRQTRHLEPEVQPGLGQGVRPGPVPARSDAKELAFYASRRRAYGTPLDSRSPAAKPEWSIWVATMAPSKAESSKSFIAPIHRYVDETPNRVPLADIYFADTGQPTRQPGAFGRRRLLHETSGGPACHRAQGALREENRYGSCHRLHPAHRWRPDRQHLKS